jgi:hypothetical protein
MELDKVVVDVMLRLDPCSAKFCYNAPFVV